MVVEARPVALGLNVLGAGDARARFFERHFSSHPNKMTDEEIYRMAWSTI